METKDKRKDTEAELKTGPLSTLHESVVNNTQILINCRNDRKLLGCVKAFDRHINLLMVDVREMWQETVRTGKGKQNKTKCHDRFISKMFLRGDSIILIVKHPKVIEK